jgi:hypothetical protein
VAPSSEGEQFDAIRVGRKKKNNGNSVLTFFFFLLHRYLLGMFGEYNVMLILFRFLQQDITNLCLAKFWIADARVHFGFTEQRDGQPIVNWNYFASAVYSLRLLHKLCKNSLGRVLELIGAKLDKPLKKLLNCNPTVRLLSLKILKCAFRLWKAKRRLQEGPLITAIFMELDLPELNDDWLTSFYLEQDESLLAGEVTTKEKKKTRHVFLVDKGCRS